MPRYNRPQVPSGTCIGATEAEIGAFFTNAQEAAGLRNCLRAMGFPQLATMMKTDDATTNGVIDNTMKKTTE